MSARILPEQLAETVERYVESELSDAAKYDNREPLDDSGVFSLHVLAAEVYAAGWEAGARAQAVQDRGRRSRERESARGLPAPTEKDAAMSADAERGRQARELSELLTDLAQSVSPLRTLVSGNEPARLTSYEFLSLASDLRQASASLNAWTDRLLDAPGGDWISGEFERARERAANPRPTRLVVTRPPVSLTTCEHGETTDHPLFDDGCPGPKDATE